MDDPIILHTPWPNLGYWLSAHMPGDLVSLGYGALNGNVATFVTLGQILEDLSRRKDLGHPSDHIETCLFFVSPDMKPTLIPRQHQVVSGAAQVCDPTLIAAIRQGLTDCFNWTTPPSVAGLPMPETTLHLCIARSPESRILAAAPMRQNVVRVSTIRNLRRAWGREWPANVAELRFFVTRRDTPALFGLLEITSFPQLIVLRSHLIEALRRLPP